MIAEVGQGIRLAYLEEGSGQPVVLVHGLCADHRAWEPQIRVLSNHYRTVAYSRRFSTINQNAGDIHEDTVLNNVEDLAGLIKKLQINPAHIVGHSYGGEIATYFAYKHPDLLRSLTIIEPSTLSAIIEDPNSGFQRFMLLLRNPSAAMALLDLAKTLIDPALKAIRRGDSTSAARLLVDGTQAKPGSFDTFPEGYRNMMIENAREIYNFEIPELSFKRADIRQIRAPTLIIKGETSHKILRQIANSLSKIIPNCELTTIPRSGHFPQVQCTQDFQSSLRGFLESHSRQ